MATMPLVHGIDLVEIDRIEDMLAKHGEAFLQRVFTDTEQRDAAAGGPRQAEHLAARFAAKEAVFKALGTGWSGGVAWTDVGVQRAPGGQPQVVIAGEAARVAADLGVTQWALSLSHTKGHAMASVVGTNA